MSKIIKSIQLIINVIRAIIILSFYFAYKICKVNIDKKYL